jgi:hypothetical protein
VVVREGGCLSFSLSLFVRVVYVQVG